MDGWMEPVVEDIEAWCIHS